MSVMEDTIKHILDEFKSIFLQDLNQVTLLNRTDAKFFFNFQKLPVILNQLKHHYKILNVEGTKAISYSTKYFDTDNLDLYHAHHNQRKNRCKVRHRTYVDSRLGFLEVKRNDAKGRTIKERISQNETTEISTEAAKQLIRENTNLDPEFLKPSLDIFYKRLTLANDYERVTIDLQIKFSFQDREVLLPGLVVAEIKQSKREPSPAFLIFQGQNLREMSFSKYCLGIISTRNEIKQNNFQDQLKKTRLCCDLIGLES